jgi:glycosyltransferase involved in cell wall biosynthesis
VIVGEGPDRKYLEKIAKGHKNIQFIGFVKDEEVKLLYEIAKVLLFCGIEDFGLVPLEAMASGTPVLAYGYGGVLETVKEGITGEFFLSEDELTDLLKNYRRNRYNKENIIKHAQEFSEEKFLINFSNYIKEIYEKEKVSSMA